MPTDEIRQQIADVLGVAPSEVESAVDNAMKDDISALDAIKQAVYLKAITGDEAAQALTPKIVELVTDFHRASKMYVEPVDNSGNTSPYQAIKNSATLLALGSQVAVATLIQVARHSKSDNARVAASTAILNRTGLGPTERSEVIMVNPDASQDGNGPTPADIIMARLKKLKAQAEKYDTIDAIEA